jgi:hypothetical protein
MARAETDWSDFQEWRCANSNCLRQPQRALSMDIAGKRRSAYHDDLLQYERGSAGPTAVCGRFPPDGCDLPGFVIK